MRYDFNEIFDRKPYSTIKWERCPAYFGSKDLLPLWVADMDFATPPFIIDAIKERLEHPILGYTLPHDSFFASVIDWQKKHFDWEISKEQLTFVPGVVPGLAYATLAFTKPDDKILVQSPVYYPFYNVIKKNRRELVINELIEENGEFKMDFTALEEQFASGVKVFFFCSPHNPGGKVWTFEEQKRVADLCEKYDVLVFADEIHCDLVFPGFKHVPFAQISDYARNNSITFIAPSKTFNMAGLAASLAIVPNKKIYNRYTAKISALESGNGNLFAYPAAEAAYSKGENWLSQLKDYVEDNIDFTIDYIEKYMPKVKPMRPQASFLIWLDFTELGLEGARLKEFINREAQLGLNDGPTFGPGGEQHQRINIAVPREILHLALIQLRTAYQQRFKD